MDCTAPPPSPAFALGAPATAAVARVAFQGEHGAYSADAVAAHWGVTAEAVPCRTFADVVAAVAGGQAPFGLLPVENTLAGSVVAAYDALAAEERVVVAGEAVLPIHHCVLGVPGATLAGVMAVESHPVALAQCGRWFGERPHIEARAAYDTAGAARSVAEAGDPRRAAIAGRGAARRFGLLVLAEDVEDRPDNQTRFFVVASANAGAVTLAEGVAARTALLAVTPNAPGALVRLLAPVAEAGLNLSKLESRPTGTPWEYRFVVEVEHAAGDPRLGDALGAMRATSRSLRALGTFARSAGGQHA